MRVANFMNFADYLLIHKNKIRENNLIWYPHGTRGKISEIKIRELGILADFTKYNSLAKKTLIWYPGQLHV